MMPAENVITEEQSCGDNDFFTSGTQWLAADTGDTQLLKDHTYCRVPPPPWNPQAEPVPLSVATRPLTLNPKKSSSNPPPLLFNPDEDLAELTFSSIETAPTKVLSSRALKN